MIRFYLAAGLALVLFINGGCSYLVVTAPPDRPEKRGNFECTSDNWAPAIDVALGSSAIIGSVVTLSAGVSVKATDEETAGEDTSSSETVLVVAGLVSLAAGVAYLSSCAYGFDTTADCRKALMRIQKRREQGGYASEIRPAAPVYQQPAGYGCTYDAQCKGNRICVSGQCVEPGQASSGVDTAPPAIAPPPAQQTGAVQPSYQEIKKSAALGDIVVYFAGVPAQQAGLASLRFVRVVPKSKFNECKSLAVVVNDEPIEIRGFEHSSEMEKSAVKETVKIEIEISDLESMIVARSVVFDVCEEKREAGRTMLSAINGFVHEFKENTKY